MSEERARVVLREHAAFHGRPLDTVIATENALAAMQAYAAERSSAAAQAERDCIANHLEVWGGGEYVVDLCVSEIRNPQA